MALNKFINHPLFALVARGVGMMGTIIACGAVWIFLDMRTETRGSIDKVAGQIKEMRNTDLKDMTTSLAILKGESAVSNVKIDEVRERVKRVEDKVYH